MINPIKILLETGYVMNKYCWTWEIPYSKNMVPEKNSNEMGMLPSKNK